MLGRAGATIGAPRPVSAPSLMSRSILLFICLCASGGLTGCGEVASSEAPRLEGQLQVGETQLRAGSNASARAAFEAVLESDPGNIDARLGLAESARRLGDATVAQRAFEEVLGLGADHAALAKALAGLAELRRSDGDTNSASELQAEADSLRAETATP